MPPKRATGLALAVAAAFLWGTIPLAAKASVAVASPVLIITARFLLAAALLAAVVVARGGGLLARPNPRELGIVAFAATALVLEYLFYLEGLARTSAVVGQVVFQLNVLLTLVLGALVFGERITPAKASGALVALAGVALVSWNGRALTDLLGSRAFAGDMLVLVAAAFWSAYLLLQKRASAGASDPLRPLVLVFVAAALVTIPATPWEEATRLPASATLAILWMAVATAGAYTCFVLALRTIEVGRAAVINTLGPVATLALVAVFHALDPVSPLWEAPTLFAAGGTALVVLGIAVVVRA